MVSARHDADKERMHQKGGVQRETEKGKRFFKIFSSSKRKSALVSLPPSLGALEHGILSPSLMSSTVKKKQLSALFMLRPFFCVVSPTPLIEIQHSSSPILSCIHASCITLCQTALPVFIYGDFACCMVDNNISYYHLLI